VPLQELMIFRAEQAPVKSSSAGFESGGHHDDHGNPEPSNV